LENPPQKLGDHVQWESKSMKTHRFTVIAESNYSRLQVEMSILMAFATRRPEACRFKLLRKNPAPRRRSNRKAAK
jgi:hypothetical protein